MKKIKFSEGYTTPQIVLLDIIVERGYLLSAPTVEEDPVED